MTDQSIFNEDTAPQDNTAKPVVQDSNDVFADQLKLIRNDAGEPKYKDVPAALEALAHAQEYIKTLKAEKEAVEEAARRASEEAEQRESVEQIVARLTGNKPQDPAPKDDQPKGTSLDETKVLELIQNTFAQQTAAQKAQGNLDKVVHELTSKFGDSTQSVVSERAKAIGTTPAALQELAKQNPDMVLALFNSSPAVNKNPSSSSINTSGLKPQEKGLEKNKTSVTRGGFTNEDLAKEWRLVREHTYKRLNIEN